MKSWRFFYLPLLLLAGGCAPSPSGGEAPAPVPAPRSAWETLAVLEAGEYPLWFELAEQGPVLINSPGEASLSPYLPWPYARYAAGLLDWQGRMVLAVNREGFLIIEAGKNGQTFLRRAAAPALWDSYTAGKPFFWDQKPGVLLYRNDFFSETPGPPPDRRVFFLEEGRPEPRGADPEALEVFPAASGWEVDSLAPGPDGFWYYRGKLAADKQYAGRTPAEYYRSPDLSLAGEKISLGLWRNSLIPEPLAAAPPLLAAFLDQALKASFVSEPAAAAVISSGFSGTRVFSASAESALLLPGYYRPEPEALAILVSPEGRALAVSGNRKVISPFSLPALPAGFSYTGIGLSGEVLVAAWEEQQDSAIGSAGFMVLKAREGLVSRGE
ncbi:MAG: hypothetical protein LBQ67_01380 [Treponema sp.]|jgi:hypothetical protein|nr:hypothetical protein [Treponema sp.]